MQGVRIGAWQTPADGAVSETVNHPPHYGGDTTYEAIRVIEAWELGFNLGNAIKYICRAGKKGATLDDLEKAKWYLQREITLEAMKPQPIVTETSAELLARMKTIIHTLRDRGIEVKPIDVREIAKGSGHIPYTHEELARGGGSGGP